MPELTYRTSSEIEIYIEVITNAFPRIYDGSNRANLTDVIEGNDEAKIGAPYYVPVDDGLQLYAEVDTTGCSL